MTRDVKGNSILHKLNSTVKLACLLLLSILIFALKDTRILTVLVGISLLLAISTKIAIHFYTRGIKTSFYLLLLTFLLNLLFTDIAYAGMITYRLGIMLVYTLLFTLTTTYMELVKGIMHLLYPLTWFKINTKDIGLIIAIGLNLMPILKIEFLNLKQAQFVKGYKPNFRKMKLYLVYLFLPFLNNCFRRVEEISMALVVKGYEEEEEDAKEA